MPCEPAPAIRPTDTRIRPTTSSTIDGMLPPLSTATKMQARPIRVASQPTTNSPGADLPSMVKMDAPGREAGAGETGAASEASGAIGVRTGAPPSGASDSGSSGESPAAPLDGGSGGGSNE